MTVSPTYNGAADITRRLGEMHFNSGAFHLPPNSVIVPTSHEAKAQFYKDTNDVLTYQFWPQAVGMGSLVGRRFIQMLGAECQYGRDTSRDENYTSQNANRVMPVQPKERGWGRSYLAFDFRREYLVIKSRLKLSDQQLPAALRPIDAELSFDDIASQGIRIEETGVRRSAPGTEDGFVQEVIVTVCIRRPPKFYTEFEASDQLPSMRSRQPYRRRATAMDFAMSSVTERDAGAIKAIPEGPCAYPTFWDTWRWIFYLSAADLSRLKGCQRKLRVIAEEDPHMKLLAKDAPQWDIRQLDAEAYKRMYGIPNLLGIEFAPRTLIEGLIAHGILRPGDTAVLIEELKRHAADIIFKCRVLESLYNVERIKNVRKIIAAKARFLRRTPLEGLEHLVMIRTVLVTPTRVLMGPPQQEPSNSVTRKYSDRLDGIIRVMFTDEEDRLFVQDYTKQCDIARPDVGVMARVRRALQHGVVLGGELFLPVASSASQQKDHAIWFINNRIIDGVALRTWMGSVDETIVAKHAARMGLPFSSTRIVELDIQIGSPLPDIERNGYCFTDGCSVAGMDVMTKAAKALNATGLNEQPSAIQFRLGGAKGVLSVWPDLAGPNEVRLRKSLIKFESSLVDLNVVRLAKHQVAFLNRQFIMIMCANGIPGKLMMDIFLESIEEIHGLKGRVMNQTMSKADVNLINTCSDFPLNALIKAGFNQNPFIRDLCDIIECRALQDLKWRARVPLNSGVFLIGIADESGTLREGEIFCQYQENEDTPAVIVESPVLVCRAPALHPGDVRKAKAVDNPRLHHLKNVIVFSTQGMRDLPNMLGGGDLDGDDFTIIWDQRFVQHLTEHAPMDYTAPPPVRINKVTQGHLNENFVQFILNDILGQVDNTHLALSDKKSPFSPECMKLSEIHSTAVDFAKTGQAAILPPFLKPKEWPDFMDKDGVKKIYRSEKILGQLFRVIRPEPHFKPCDIRDLDYPVDPRMEQIPIHESLIGRLKPIKKAYEHSLSWDMRRYRVVEPEIPSGVAIKNKRRKRARDQNLNEPLQDAYNIHVKNTREEAMKAVQDIKFNTRFTGAQYVARHCYAMTYERKYVEEWEEEQKLGFIEAEGEDVEYMRLTPMISFAWVFWQELVQIVQPDLL